jgi:hypothetical protein
MRIVCWMLGHWPVALDRAADGTPLYRCLTCFASWPRPVATSTREDP